MCTCKTNLSVYSLVLTFFLFPALSSELLAQSYIYCSQIPRFQERVIDAVPPEDPIVLFVAEGASLNLTFFQSDNTGGPMSGGTPTWSFVTLPAGIINSTPVNGNSNTLSGTPSAVGSPHEFSVTLANGTSGFTATQTLNFILYVSKPTDISLVLDVSGSMGIVDNAALTPKSRLTLLQEAVNKFIDTYLIFASAFPADMADSLGITYFTNDTVRYKPGTTNLFALDATNAASAKASVNLTSPLSSTGMGIGVMSGLSPLRINYPERRRNIILFTDGMQNTPRPKIIGEPIMGGGFRAFFEAGEPATSYLSGAPGGTNLSVTPFNHVKISTIGMAGGSTSFYSNLENISNATSGYTHAVDITSPSDLSYEFIDELTKKLRGSSPQLVDVRSGADNGSVSEIFTFGRTVRKVLFIMSRNNSQANGFDVLKGSQSLRRLGKTVEGSGYKIFSIDLPIRDSLRNVINASGDWTVKLTGSNNEPYEIIALVDDHALKYESMVTSTGRINAPLQLKVNLGFHKTPISDAQTVKAIVLKPGQDLGTLLSTAQINRDRKPTQNTQDLSVGGHKLTQLLSDSAIFNSLIPVEQLITLTSNNDGTYTGIFTNTDVTGPYKIAFRIEGDGSRTGKYIRTEMQTVVLQLNEVTLNESSPSTQRVGDTLKIVFRPRSKAGLYLGPDYDNAIKVTTEVGKVGDIIDHADGTYTILITGVSGDANPKISITVLGQKIYEDNANDFGKPWWMKYWWVWLILLVIILLIWRLKK